MAIDNQLEAERERVLEVLDGMEESGPNGAAFAREHRHHILNLNLRDRRPSERAELLDFFSSIYVIDGGVKFSNQFLYWVADGNSEILGTA